MYFVLLFFSDCNTVCIHGPEFSGIPTAPGPVELRRMSLDALTPLVHCGGRASDGNAHASGSECLVEVHVPSTPSCIVFILAIYHK